MKPGVTSKMQAAKLAGKIVNLAPPKTLSLVVPAVDRQEILSNMPRKNRGRGSEASVSGTTSTANQYNLYHFDESSTLKTYKKMGTLHSKDEMFRTLKFITVTQC
jgi:hypothetical protein